MTNHDNRREMQRTARRLAKTKDTSYQFELNRLQNTSDLPPFEWDFRHGHLMVTGPARSGKTVLLKHLADKALSEGHRVVVLTNRLSEWNDERLEVLSDLESAAATLLRSAFRDRTETQPTLIVVDTLAHFAEPYGSGRTEREYARLIRGYLGRITREGRASGIHLAVAAQRLFVRDLDIAANCEHVMVGLNSHAHKLYIGIDMWPGVDDVPAKHGVVFTPSGPKKLTL